MNDTTGIGFHSCWEPHTIVILLFGLALVKVDLSEPAKASELFDQIISSDAYKLPVRVHEIAQEYRSSLRFRYSIPEDPFPVSFNEIPRIMDLPCLEPIKSIPVMTHGCTRSLPSDGSVINLVVEEPLPLSTMESPDTRDIFSSREVVQFMLSHDAEVFPTTVYGSVAFGYMNGRKDKICCKLVNEDELSVSKDLQSLSPEDHHIATLIFPPLALPTGRFMITMPHYGQNLSRVEGEELSEDIVLKIIHQLCDAVLLLHTNLWYHLDIKPQNLALSLETYDLTLIDLGWLIKASAPNSIFQHATGTKGWVSPQVQRWHRYSDTRHLRAGDMCTNHPPYYWPGKTDVWAIGKVILYLLEKDGLAMKAKMRTRLTNFAKILTAEEEKNRPPILQVVEVFDKRFGSLLRTTTSTLPSLATITPNQCTNVAQESPTLPAVMSAC